MTGPALKTRKLPDTTLQAINDAKLYESIPYHTQARDLGLTRAQLARQLKEWRKKNGC